jgi:hypothetical protein
MGKEMSLLYVRLDVVCLFGAKARGFDARQLPIFYWGENSCPVLAGVDFPKLGESSTPKILQLLVFDLFLPVFRKNIRVNET